MIGDGRPDGKPRCERLQCFLCGSEDFAVFALLLQCSEPIQIGPRARPALGPGQRFQSLRALRETDCLAQPGVRLAVALCS